MTDPAELPVPDWHQRVLEERLVAHRADPGAAFHITARSLLKTEPNDD